MKRLINYLPVILFLLLALLFNKLFAQDFKWNWVRNGGGTGWDHGYALAIDKDQNVIVRGKFVGTATFGDTTISTSKTEADYLAKYGPEGNLIWVMRIDGKASWEKDRSLTTDSKGNIYITGYFSDTIRFGVIQLISEDNYDTYLAKLTPDGEVVWAKAAGGANKDIAYSVVADHEDNIVVTGYFMDKLTVGTQTFSSSGGKDMFIAKYNCNGEIQWAKHGSGLNDVFGSCLTVDNENNVYVLGSFSGNAHFNSATLASSTGEDIFIVKYQPDGSPVAFCHDGGYANVEAKSICWQDDKLYVSGRFSGHATFGTQFKIQATGQYDIYLVKYNKYLKAEWAIKAGGDFADQGNSVFAINNRIYITGDFYGEMSVGDSIISTDGVRDIFIASLDTSANVLWLEKGGTSSQGYNNGFGNSVVADESGNVYVCGEFSGITSFDGLNIKPEGSFDMFVCVIHDNTVLSSSVKPEIINTVQFNVYPNPVNDHCIITNPQQLPGIYELYDLKGKLIFSGSCHKPEQRVDMTSLPRSYYILKLQYGEVAELKKIFKF